MKYLRIIAVCVLAVIAGLWVTSPFIPYQSWLESAAHAQTVETPAEAVEEPVETQTFVTVQQEADTVAVKEPASVAIKAPDKVKAGELVVLDVSESYAASFSWTVMPETDNFMVIDGGRRAVFSSGVGGEFTFIVAAANENTVDVKIHKIKVIGSEPTDTLEAKVALWCEGVTSPTKRDDALKLSQSFSSVAAMITDTMTPADITEATKKSNRSALGDNHTHWHPFLEGLQKELATLAGSGKLTDAKSHVQAWQAVAEGLRQYAESLK